MIDIDRQLDTILEREEGDTDVIGTVAVFRELPQKPLEVLVTKRKLPPSAGQWSLPGGHVKKGEKPLDGALRELEEETGIKRHTATFVKNQRAPKERGRIEFIFASKLPGAGSINRGSDSRDLKWVPVKDLPRLAFKHADAVHEAAVKLLGASALKEYYIPQAMMICEDLAGVSESKKLKRTVQSILDQEHRDEGGLLIVFEGIDGVGKTTQVSKLIEWLEEQDYAVTSTKWNSSKLLKKAIDKAKDRRMLTPVLYCLLHAADMMVRYQEDILPALARNEIVICDRYWYTSAVRDQARGIDAVIPEKIYKDVREPDVVLHCTCPIEVAFHRLIGDKGLSFYGSGMDLHLSPSKEENCIKYYHKMIELYNKVLPKAKHCQELNMNKTIDQIFAEVKKIMGTKFGIGKYTRSK